jgi:hypothetical protein
MSATFKAAALRAAASASSTPAQNSTAPTPSLRRSKSLSDLPVAARAVTPETGQWLRRSSVSDLTRLLAQHKSILDLPPEIIEKIVAPLSFQDKKSLVQTSRYFRAASQEIFKEELDAKKKIDALMDSMVSHFVSNTIADPGLFTVEGPLKRIVEVPMVSQYLTDALAKSRVAHIELSKLTQVPVFNMAQEEKRAEMVLMFCSAIVDAIRNSEHLEAVKLELCETAVLSSGKLIRRNQGQFDVTHFMFGGSHPRTPIRPKLESVDIGLPARGDFLLDFESFQGLNQCQNVKQLNLRLNHTDPLRHITNNYHLWSDHPFHLASSIQKFGLGLDAIKSFSNARTKLPFGENAPLEGDGLHATLRKVTARSDMVNDAAGLKRRLRDEKRGMTCLLNTTQATVLPPLNPSTPFTPSDLKVSTQLFLKIPQLETMVTPPVASDTAEGQEALKYSMRQAQAHPHLTLIKMGAEHYQRSRARLDVAFDKV